MLSIINNCASIIIEMETIINYANLSKNINIINKRLQNFLESILSQVGIGHTCN